jgi:hypothetical protein
VSEQRTGRSEYVSVHRHVWYCLLLLLAAHINDDFTSWTGWHILAAFSATARILSVVYAIMWLARRSVKGTTRRD